MSRFRRILVVLVCLPLLGSVTGVASAETAAADPCLKAVSTVSGSGRATYVCFAGVATVTTKAAAGSKKFVVDEKTLLSRDVTGKSEAEERKLLAEVHRNAPVHLLTGYVDSLYRGRTEDTLEYGSAGGGGPNFSSSIYFRAIISLQSNNHRFEYYWSQKDNRQIALRAVIQLKRYIYFPGTDVVEDTVPLQNSVFATNDTKYTYLQTRYSDTQIFYYNIANINVNDRAAGREYKISGDIPGPYFRCAPPGGCIYPNGLPASP